MRAAVLRRLRGSRGRLIYRSPSRSNRPMIGPLDGDLIGDVRQMARANHDVGGAMRETTHQERDRRGQVDAG
jgi:hypothetical protein